MARDVAFIHPKDARKDVWMPYASGLKVSKDRILFIARCTTAPVYHSNPHTQRNSKASPKIWRSRPRWFSKASEPAYNRSTSQSSI